MNFFSRMNRKDKNTSSLQPSEWRRPDWLMNACSDQTAGLLLRVDEALERRPRRLVQFIAAGPGEGTSSVAWAYACASSKMLQRRVLLLSDMVADKPDSLVEPVDMSSVVPDSGTARAEDGLTVVTLCDPVAADGGARHDVMSKVFWQKIREQYDEVVIDSPCMTESPLGLFIASHADAVIVVVEAEKTRAPVARQMINDLDSVHANIIGSVLNKRKFYVPKAIYSRL